VAQSVEGQDGRLLDHLDKWQREIAGYSEKLTRASRPEHLEHCLRNVLRTASRVLGEIAEAA